MSPWLIFTEYNCGSQLDKFQACRLSSPSQWDHLWNISVFEQYIQESSESTKQVKSDLATSSNHSLEDGRQHKAQFFLSHRLIQGFLAIVALLSHRVAQWLVWASLYQLSTAPMWHCVEQVNGHGPGRGGPEANFFKLRQASMLVVRMKQDFLGPEWKHKARQSTICIKVKMVKTLWRLWFHSASPTDQHWSTTARLTRPKCVAGWCWMMLDAADSGQGSFGQQKDRGLKF